MLMVKFELSGEAAYEVVSLEAKYRNMKSLPVWVIYPHEDRET